MESICALHADTQRQSTAIFGLAHLLCIQRIPGGGKLGVRVQIHSVSFLTDIFCERSRQPLQEAPPFRSSQRLAHVGGAMEEFGWNHYPQCRLCWAGDEKATATLSNSR
jgi:hypothetical protein